MGFSILAAAILNPDSVASILKAPWSLDTSFGRSTLSFIPPPTRVPDHIGKRVYN